MTANRLSQSPGPIGVFDSGYGGLTILSGIRRLMPEYDYIYLGDNARAPYGTRSFEVVRDFTRQAVEYLFEKGCHLVVLGCNTASAKALRSFQQLYLPQIDPARRVLGIIIPTAEIIGSITWSRHVGVLATEGTIRSRSYNIEIEKRYPDIQVTGVPCPMWVPLVENNEASGDGADYFVEKYLRQLLAADDQIDTVILGCTHYPMLVPKIRRVLDQLHPGMNIVEQGTYVAESLRNYLDRHPEMDAKCSRGGKVRYLTTESAEKFSERACLFLNERVEVESVVLGETAERL